MKNLVLSLMFLIALSGVAAAESYIGLFDDGEATVCYGDAPLYVTKTIHVIAWLDPEINAITAAEFRLENLPVSGPNGVVTEHWDTTLVIGDSEWNIALAFQVPVPGPLAHLGNLDFFCIQETWIGNDFVISVRPGNTRGTLALVDENYETFNVLGGQYTFNCSNPLDCDCLDTVPVHDVNWSSVKALY